MIQLIKNIIYNNITKVINQGTYFTRSKPYSLTEIYVGKKAYLYIGRDCCINSFTQIKAKNYIAIHDKVLISPNCFISDHQHDYKSKDRINNFRIGMIILEQNCFIGFGSIIINSTIGINSIVGTNSVVIDFNIPDNHIFIGDCRLKYIMKKIK